MRFPERHCKDCGELMPGHLLSEGYCNRCYWKDTPLEEVKEDAGSGPVIDPDVPF